MTQRVVSVWFSHWRTDRLERLADYQGRPRPRVIFQSGQGGDRIIALNRIAEREGLHMGLLLTDAKAIVPTLQAIPSDPEEEQQELERMARWCVRFSPWVTPNFPDGLFLDVTGVTHLFGGEKAFLKMLYEVFSGLQFDVHIAMADTAGAAWGFARYGSDRLMCIPSGEQRERAHSLSVKALRISDDHAEQLDQLGLNRLGQLHDISKLNVRPRFGTILLKRLEQFLYPGRESLSPLIPEPEYFSSFHLPEPIGKIEDVQAGVQILLERVTDKLASHGKGASSFTLRLYGMTGGCYSLPVKTSAPTKEKEHIALLFKERLNALEHSFDPTFDIDAFSLDAQEVSTFENKQAFLSDEQHGDCNVHLLLDRLTARLGHDAVKSYRFRESHIPERAVTTVAPNSTEEKGAFAAAPRPILLLPSPELIKAIAEIPDYPPRQFEWRYRTYRVVKAEGPERISHEWWKHKGDRISRDYFRVEDQTGARFWLFREGIYQRETNAPKWFMHGVFA